jgi:hypothetical protein
MADFSSIAPLIDQMSKSIDETRSVLEELIEISLHIHDSHWHGVVHTAEMLSGESGGAFIPIPSDEVSFLLSEFNNKLDKDDNGLVYGIDFLIDSQDPLCPQSLRYVEQTLIHEKKVLPTVLMNWDEYLKTVPWIV